MVCFRTFLSFLLFSWCCYRQWDCNEEDMVRRLDQIKTESIGDAISMQLPAFESIDNIISMSTTFISTIFCCFDLSWVEFYSHCWWLFIWVIFCVCLSSSMNGAYLIMYLWLFFQSNCFFIHRPQFLFIFSFYNLLIVNRKKNWFLFQILN